MILASILILPDDTRIERLPQPVERNIASFRRMHPGIEHRLFTNGHVRQILSDHFGREVLSTYDRLKPFAYKCDLARYCIMHVFGGIYADLSIRFLGPLVPTSGGRACPDTTLRIFRDFLSGAPWGTVSGVFAAPPRHKAMAKAIDLICGNVETGYRGATPLCPTGPNLFGRAIAITCTTDDLTTGDSMWLHFPRAGLRQFADGTRHAMLFGQKLICFKERNPAGSFHDLGLAGANSYGDMWNAGDIYGERGTP